MDLSKIDKYLAEAEENGGFEQELSQKVDLLAVILDKKKQAPMMKKVVRKAMVGKPLGDSERQILATIIERFFRPEKAKFNRLTKKF